ncbi:hypothetical protein D9619_007828 [Psilocybe cf. subviscida]|uniref:small monomeric GTPase n=1 Tax=Psilocybe cf. subviscida TaxID=2480587 RepID=A0A8H5AUP3_9AGAR|nr:hypothetical protein D9619_007828 [Psilocybe cf. subviscida]
MYSVTSRWSFQDVARTCRQVPLSTAHDPNLVLVLVGTKADEKASREVSTEEGLALASDLGCQAFYETSAKTGQNVDATIFATVKALRKSAREKRVDLMSPIHMVRGWLKRI